MAVEPPTLRTERLELRPPVAGDFPATLAIVAEPATARYLWAHSATAEHFLRFCRSAGSWLLYGYGVFVIRPRGSEEVIGTCGVFHTWRDLGPDFDDQPEAGWILRSDQVGRGLAHEAASAAVDWFEREHGPRRIVCMIATGNAPSLRLASKLGFAPLREAVLPDGDSVALLARAPAKA